MKAVRQHAMVRGHECQWGTLILPYGLVLLGHLQPYFAHILLNQESDTGSQHAQDGGGRLLNVNIVALSGRVFFAVAKKRGHHIHGHILIVAVIRCAGR